MAVNPDSAAVEFRDIPGNVVAADHRSNRVIAINPLRADNDDSSSGFDRVVVNDDIVGNRPDEPAEG